MKPSQALPRKKLPIGIQNLREIHEEGCYYVDKSPFALQLIEQGKYYFLSRPRRFGKSLLIDTLKALFEGHQALFSRLYAEQHWDWSVTYPVIHLSFGAGVMQKGSDLEHSLNKQSQASKHNLELRQTLKHIYPAALVRSSKNSTNKALSKWWYW